MIFEHEIPNGSKLYFGEAAKQKRKLENNIAQMLYDEGYEEILTPIFSYYQHQSIEDETKLIKFSDTSNNQIALRADSTLDAVRIITKRLGRTTTHKKWFYVQPVFSYPNEEQNQIGCEWIEHDDICNVINLATKIITSLKIKPTLQVSNINIPKLIATHLGIDSKIFQDGDVSTLAGLNIDWLDALLWTNSLEDLKKAIKLAPDFLESELNALIDACEKISFEKIVVAPLYQCSLIYYKGLYFRVFDKNETIIKGGRYTTKSSNNERVDSLGFAIYTDTLLNFLEE
jgi:histidyl-tRNA synthetase